MITTFRQEKENQGASSSSSNANPNQSGPQINDFEGLLKEEKSMKEHVKFLYGKYGERLQKFDDDLAEINALLHNIYDSMIDSTTTKTNENVKPSVFKFLILLWYYFYTLLAVVISVIHNDSCILINVVSKEIPSWCLFWTLQSYVKGQLKYTFGFTFSLLISLFTSWYLPKESHWVFCLLFQIVATFGCSLMKKTHSLINMSILQLGGSLTFLRNAYTNYMTLYLIQANGICLFIIIEMLIFGLVRMIHKILFVTLHSNLHLNMIDEYVETKMKKLQLKGYMGAIEEGKFQIHKPLKAYITRLSHKIRAPLNSISDAIRELEKSHPTKIQSNAIQGIKFCSDDILKAISDLEEYTDYTESSKKIVFRCHMIDIYQLMHQVMDKSKVRAKYMRSNPVIFNFKIDKMVPRVIVADEKRINQIFSHLIENSLGSLDDSKVSTVSFKVKLSETQNPFLHFQKSVFVFDNDVPLDSFPLKLTFDIVDNGFGFGKREQDEILNPNSASIGIKLVSFLLEKMKGKLEIRSIPCKETTVRFCVNIWGTKLPCLPTTAPTYIPDSISTHMVVQQYPIDIIVAEDSVLHQRVVNRLLEQFGYTNVPILSNGSELIDKIVKEAKIVRYDLILMDLRMPKLNGKQAVPKIRKLVKEGRLGYNPKIFAVTADTLEKDKRECERLGFDGHIGKPITIRKLLVAIKLAWTAKMNRRIYQDELVEAAHVKHERSVAKIAQFNPANCVYSNLKNQETH